MIELTHEGDVAVLRMAHGQANALDLELCNALTTSSKRIGSRPPRRSSSPAAAAYFPQAWIWCAWRMEGAAYVRVFLPALNRAVETLFSLLKPVVAAVNGHAIAGGCIIACAPIIA